MKIDDPVQSLRTPQPPAYNGAPTYDQHEAWVKEAPDIYRVIAFRGGAAYDRAEAATLELARTYAKLMKTNRPVMIYAERGVHGIHLENV